jgi:hypothetical protein
MGHCTTNYPRPTGQVPERAAAAKHKIRRAGAARTRRRTGERSPAAAEAQGK